MEVTGKIKLINETETYGTFQKRSVVIVTDEQYPQTLSLEFVQDKCSLLDKYKKDDNVKVSINLRGKEWVNPEGVAKYFNTIQGWRIEKVEESEIPSAEQFQPQTQTAEQDDLPF